MGSSHSAYSQESPTSNGMGPDGESSDRGRCPYAGCGRVIKDLRSHMLTHKSERPEKCPIVKCPYHVKGFARKYDKCRHTLTHYKGTMVCGFCPGSGSASEKSFNRADVFKRHLTSVHGVEQSPPNSRKKSPSANRTISTDESAEGKCSTCSTVFSSVQEFYDHLDDCVLRILEHPEKSEMYNEQHLNGIADDEDVKETLERNLLPIEVPFGPEGLDGSADEDEDIDDCDHEKEYESAVTSMHTLNKNSLQEKANAVSTRSNYGKGRGRISKSKSANPMVGKGRKKRKEYPHAWGCGKEQLKMKKRVLWVHDGSQRVWKDEMMLDSGHEVRVPLPGVGDSYVTDLDIETMQRARNMLNNNNDQQGPWLADDEVTRLMQ